MTDVDHEATTVGKRVAARRERPVLSTLGEILKEALYVCSAHGSYHDALHLRNELEKWDDAHSVDEDEGALIDLIALLHTRYDVPLGDCAWAERYFAAAPCYHSWRYAQRVSYRNNTCGMPAFFVGSHLPPIVFEMALEAWNAVRPVLDPVSQLRPPDSIIPTFYQGEETIVMHSDSRPSERGKRVEQRRGTSVMAISFGDDMDFWARKFIRGSGDKKETGPDFFVKRMGHLSVFVWRFRADHAWEHSPRFEKFPRGACWDRARTAIICRWIDAVRWYETEKPYFTCCGGDAWLRPETRGAKCGCSRCEE